MHAWNDTAFGSRSKGGAARERRRLRVSAGSGSSFGAQGASAPGESGCSLRVSTEPSGSAERERSRSNRLVFSDSSEASGMSGPRGSSDPGGAGRCLVRRGLRISRDWAARPPQQELRLPRGERTPAPDRGFGSRKRWWPERKGPRSRKQRRAGAQRTSVRRETARPNGWGIRVPDMTARPDRKGPRVPDGTGHSIERDFGPRRESELEPVRLRSRWGISGGLGPPRGERLRSVSTRWFASAHRFGERDGASDSFEVSASVG